MCYLQPNTENGFITFLQRLRVIFLEICISSSLSVIPRHHTRTSIEQQRILYVCAYFSDLLSRGEAKSEVMTIIESTNKNKCSTTSRLFNKIRDCRKYVARYLRAWMDGFAGRFPFPSSLANIYHDYPIRFLRLYTRSLNTRRRLDVRRRAHAREMCTPFRSHGKVEIPERILFESFRTSSDCRAYNLRLIDQKVTAIYR